MERKHKLIVGSIIVFIISLVVVAIFTITPRENILIENSVSKEKAELVVVTIGERIQNDKTYFIQWETLNTTEKEKVLTENDIFLFSASEFTNETNVLFIKSLLEEKKTVLFYGNKMNVEDILNKTGNLIPYYQIQSEQQIFHYLYGYGYSNEHKTMIPITIMGNFSENDIDSNISNYLIKTYGIKKTE